MASMQPSWVPLPNSSSASSYPFETELPSAVPRTYSDSPLRIPTPEKHLMHNPLNVYARQEVMNISGASYSDKLLLVSCIQWEVYLLVADICRPHLTSWHPNIFALWRLYCARSCLYCARSSSIAGCSSLYLNHAATLSTPSQ